MEHTYHDNTVLCSELIDRDRHCSQPPSLGDCCCCYEADSWYAPILFMGYAEGEKADYHCCAEVLKERSGEGVEGEIGGIVAVGTV